MVRTRVPPRCSRRLKRPNMNTTGPEHRFEKRPAYCTRDLPRASAARTWKRLPILRSAASTPTRCSATSVSSLRKSPRYAGRKRWLDPLLWRGIFGWSITHGISESARNRIFHDLGSSTVDSMNARRRVQLGDRILIHVAGAAVQLHAPVQDPTLELREPELRHRRSTVVELTAQHPCDAVVIERPAVGDLRMHLGENELRVLEIENPLAESLAVLDEGERQGESELRSAQSARGDRQPLLRQFLHQHCESASRWPEEARRRNPQVLEEKLGRVARLHAHLVEVPTPDVAVPRALDEEQADALGAGTRIRHGSREDDLPRADLRQVVPPLVFRPEIEDMKAREARFESHAGARAGGAAAELLG